MKIIKKIIVKLSKHNKILPMYNKTTWNIYPTKKELLYYRLLIFYSILL